MPSRRDGPVLVYAHRSVQDRQKSCEKSTVDRLTLV
jgi:hypothetical protein